MLTAAYSFLISACRERKLSDCLAAGFVVIPVLDLGSIDPLARLACYDPFCDFKRSIQRIQRIVIDIDLEDFRELGRLGGRTGVFDLS